MSELTVHSAFYIGKRLLKFKCAFELENKIESKILTRLIKEMITVYMHYKSST